MAGAAAQLTEERTRSAPSNQRAAGRTFHRETRRATGTGRVGQRSARSSRKSRKRRTWNNERAVGQQRRRSSISRQAGTQPKRADQTRKATHARTHSTTQSQLRAERA
ncbi:unnamed protein product [Calypogeia fissa]